MFVIFLAQYCLILLGYFDLIALAPGSLVRAFNIDEEYPIVISNTFNGENSHFGASVVLLESDSSTTRNYHIGNDNDVKGWVVIGAPKANSSNANHSGIFEPGIIMRCSLRHSVIKQFENRDDLCQIMEMDPTGEYDPFDPQLPFKDRKDGGWLGGSMFVGDSDRFVTCASRWVNQKYRGSYLQNGICYWLPKSHVTASITNSTWPWLAPKYSYRLSPLVNGSKQSVTTYSPYNETYNEPISLFNWKYGQFGFSVHITPNNEMIAGSVGVLDWTGSVVQYTDKVGPRSQFRRYNSHPRFSEFSEVVVADVQDDTDSLKSSEYFGYSVTSGRFFMGNVSNDNTQFAAGAPRSSQLSGKVLVFSLAERQTGRSEGRLKLLVEPIEGHLTSGNHYGSYFGASLVALDMNGDGFDELVVGAPLYGTSLRVKRNAFVPVLSPEEGTSANAEPSPKMKSGDEGCVFVYLSNGFDFDRVPRELCGDKSSGARFGTSIASLGDINSDGYNDVAVGAPYENEGRGAVYIYHGGIGENFLRLAQKLEPRDLDPKMKTFGWSLSHGVDIDENGYPDLAVGAYESNQVVIYRTVPIIKFNATLAASIPKLLANTDKFLLITCISYTGQSTPHALDIHLKWTIETESPESKRLVSLVLDDLSNSGMPMSSDENTASGRSSNIRAMMISRKEKLRLRKNARTCYNITAMRFGVVDGLKRNVPIRLDYWIDGYDSDIRSQKPIRYEIKPSLDNKHSTVSLASSESDFYEKRPMPADNVFGTVNLNIPVGHLCESDGEPTCVANLTMSAWLADKSNEYHIFNETNPFILGSADILTLEVELSNHRELANPPITVKLQWTQPPVIRRLPANCQLKEDSTGLISISNSTKSNFYVCIIQKSIKTSQKEILAVELRMSKVYGKPQDTNLEIELEANTTSELVGNGEIPKYKLVVPLKTQMRPQNFSHVASRIEYSGNISNPMFGIPQAFEIGLDGPTSAAALKIEFDIPVRVKINGQMHTLIAVKKPIIAHGGSMTCEAVNDTFFDEESAFPEQTKTDPPPHDAPIISLESVQSRQFFNGDDDNDGALGSAANEGMAILRGKLKRVTRSALGVFSTNSYRKDALAYSPGENRDGVTLRINCDSKSASCLRVTCVESDFTPEKKAVVEFKLRMFTGVASTLLNPANHDEEITSLWVESIGTVKTLDANGNPFGETGHLYFKSRLIIPPPYELPALILLLSVAGGLLLLSVLTMILMKCGFFRRTKRDELQLLRQRKQIEQRFQRGKSNLLQSTESRTGTASTALICTTSSTRSGKPSRKRSFKISELNNASSIMPISCNSPGTMAKQIQKPGAVDLHELNRMYDFADQNGLYD